MIENYSNVLAVAALIFGSLMSVGYIPQAYKIWKRKSVEDISLPFFAILLWGMGVWMLYGISIKNIPLVFTNCVGIIGSGTIISLYFRYKIRK